MIYWAPLFHFYQPPTQTPGMLLRISNESYGPLLDVLTEYAPARATVNINGVLTEMLYECGHNDVIKKLKTLAEDKKIEFTGSGKYHPILPLIPVKEMDRQIRRNNLTNRHFFGDAYSPRGFFPPEMCYSNEIIDPIIESRHEWIILSGVACPVDWPMDVVHDVGRDVDRLAVFFRDDILSNKISFRDIDGKGFVSHLREMHSGENDVYVVTAMDAETFGHHIQHWEKLFLAQVYETLEPEPEETVPPGSPVAEQHRKLFEFQKSQRQIQIVTISELLNHFPKGSRIEPKQSSWSTTIDDIRAGNYYPLWKDKNNPIHRMLWELLSLTMELQRSAAELSDNATSKHFAEISRSMLDQALHSDQFWWASRRPMWDINMIFRGLTSQQEVLLNSYKAVTTSGADPEAKRQSYYKVVAARHISSQLIDALYVD